MPDTASKKLSLVKELINNGKYEEALKHINDIEQKENLTPEETLRTMNYKSWSYHYLGQFDLAFNLVEELYHKSKVMKMPLFSIDALSHKALIFLVRQEPDEFIEFSEQSENIYNSIPREKSLEFQEREAFLFTFQGSVHFLKGNLDLALNSHSKSLALFEHIDPHHFFKPITLFALAYDYQYKGELKLAIEHNEKALSFIPEGEYFIQLGWKGSIYRNLGECSYLKGDLNKALEYHSQSLEFFEKNKASNWGEPYVSIIKVLIAKKNINQARNYLQQFKEFNKKHETGISKALYQLSHALILKSSSRMRDRAEAENILKKLVEENVNIITTNLALLPLCDLYFEEFQLSNQLELLDDIQPLIDQLLRNAKLQNSYSSLANVKLLQAKLALIQVNMVEARKLLTEAQQIADDHDLQLLAGEISREHDRLLEELELWESIKKTKASVSERLKLASIDDVLERMQGRRAIEALDVVNEEPVLLAIISKTGYMVLTNPFSVEIPFDEKRVGEFVSFLNSISDQIFSESIDRVKFGKFTILHKVIDSISICYLFEGQSYTALKRVNNFYEVIKNNSSIMDVLTLSKKTGESINLNENPELETLIAEIFLSDSRKHQISPQKKDMKKLIKKSRQIRKKRSARKKKVMRIVVTEIIIEIIALLLFLNSHLLFLGYVADFPPPLEIPIGSGGWMLIIELALYLGLGFQLIVLNYMFINWRKAVLKNSFVIAEIITQIIALLLIFTSHLFYLESVDKLHMLSEQSHATIWFIINLTLYLGIACNLLVIVLINVDYMKHH